MSSSFGRGRSTEAPMSGIEFTNRANTIPAWRRDAEQDDPNTPLKRTYSIANPPPSPFNPKKNNEARPLVGDNATYLFRPQIPSNVLASSSQPSFGWSSQPGFTSTAPDTPEVDMRDVDHTSPSSTLPGTHVELVREGNEKSESPETRLTSNAAVRRLERKRRNATGRSRSRLGGSRSRLAEDSSDEDENSDDERSFITRKTSNHYTLNVPGPVMHKSETPYILLGYLQFAFNLSLILVFLYLLVQFILTVQRDVEQRVSEYSMEILQEISTCTTQYRTNLCATNPIPAMTHQCAAWETCMSRDPSVVGRAKVGAEMLAEVVNGFVEPISWKTLVFTLSSLAFMTVFVNALLSLYRSKLHKEALPASPNPHSGQLHLPMQPQFAIPPYGYVPGPMMWRPEDEAVQTPSRRRRLENGEAAKVT